MSGVLDVIQRAQNTLIPYGATWNDSMEILIASINDPAVNKEVIKIICSKYMIVCPLNDVDAKVHSFVCPHLNETISNIIDHIEKQLDDSEVIKNLEPTTFDKEFIEIKNLLARWHEVLKSAMSTLSPSTKYPNIVNYLPTSVIKIGKHCKNYRRKYLNRSLPLLLQDVYRDICSLVKSYCTVLCKLFSFNFMFEQDFVSLNKILKGLGNMAPYIDYGISTIIQTWRALKHLACINTYKIRERKDIVDLVRGSLKSIANSIIKIYKSIVMRPQDEFITRIKCTKLLLDIFIDLHKLYCTDRCPHSMDAEFINDMIHVLIEFIGYLELCRAWNFDTGKCSDTDEIIKTPWPKLIMNYYCTSEHYLPAFHNQAKEIDDKTDPIYALGFHYCLLHYEIFTKQECLDMALENINYIQVEMMQQLTRVPDWGTIEGGMCDARIYEYTLAILCRNCEFLKDSNSFSHYEDILMKHLLSERFWSSLLAYDILIFCYTCSNKDVAFTHIQYFMMAYETLNERQHDSLAVVMLQRIIIDIYKLLPGEKIDELLEQCKCPNSLLIILKSNFQRSDKKTLVMYKKLTCTVPSRNLPEVMANLEQQPSVKNWTQLMNILTVMGIDEDENNEEWIERCLLDITFSAIQTVKKLDENNKQRMMYDLLLILFNCAHIQKQEREIPRIYWRLFMALSEGLLEFNDVPECILIKFCYYLNRLSVNPVCLFGSYDIDKTNIVPVLFIYLLENNSKFVYQEALECFDQTVEMSDENFVTKISSAIARRPKLYEAVPAYLRRQKFPKSTSDKSMPEGWRSYSTIHSIFCEFAIKHKCYINEMCDYREKKPKLCEESLEERTNRLTNELIELSRENINIIPIASEKLKDACRIFIEK